MLTFLPFSYTYTKLKDYLYNYSFKHGQIFVKIFVNYTGIINGENKYVILDTFKLLILKVNNV